MTASQFKDLYPDLHTWLVELTQPVGRVTVVYECPDDEKVLFEALVEWDEGVSWGVAVYDMDSHSWRWS